MKFVARGGEGHNPRVFHPSLAGPIRFEDGKYETDDEAEIAVLQRHPRVRAVDENLSKLTRDQLDLRAEQVGIDDPGSYKTKGDLVKAIEKA